MNMNYLSQRTAEINPSLFKLVSLGLLLFFLSLMPEITVGQYPQRTVVLEEFTGEWCGWCPIGMMEMEEMIERYGDTLIPVAVHSGDAMETPSAGDMISAWGSFYPSGLINRIYDTIVGAQTLATDEWEEVISRQIATPAPCLAQLSYAYEETSRTITADVTASFTADFTGDGRLNLYIIEDSVTGDAQHNYLSGNPEFINTPFYNLPDPIPGFVHRHVLREMVGESYGIDGIIPDTVFAGQSFTYTFTYTIPDECNTARLSLIAVVHKHKGLKKYRCILNARQEKFSPLGTGILSVFQRDAIRVWPNPATDFVKIKTIGIKPISSIRVCTLSGAWVATYENPGKEVCLSVTDWPGSCFVLRIQTGTGEIFHRLLMKNQ